MSDPMTNLEIQDVLSSIRRLVSEDSRHGPEGEAVEVDAVADEAPADAQAGADAGKLVLTDALRVADTDEAAPPEGDETLRENITGDGHYEDGEPVAELDSAADADALSDEPVLDWDRDAAEESGAGSSLEDTIAELEAAVAGIGGEFEPDGSELAGAAETGADAALDEAFEDGFAVDVAADEEEAELARPVTSGDVGAGPDEAARTEPDEEMASDDPSDGDDAADRAEESADVSEATDQAEETEEEPAPSDVEEIGAAQVTDGEEGDVSGADSLIFMSRGGSDRDAPEPDKDRVRRLNLSASDRVAPEAETPWDHANDDAAVQDPGNEADPTAVEPDSDSAEAVPGLFEAAVDEAVLDMDMLRDLVAEIIREELQGPLGERITRNVRMLVRREINRALESRDLD